MVGVNDYREGDDAELEILRIDPALERKQIGRVQAVRARATASRSSGRSPSSRRRRPTTIAT